MLTHAVALLDYYDLRTQPILVENVCPVVINAVGQLLATAGNRVVLSAMGTGLCHRIHCDGIIGDIFFVIKMMSIESEQLTCINALCPR